MWIVFSVKEVFLYTPFQPSVAIHLETSHLICSANQMTGFYMNCNPELNWVNLYDLSFFLFSQLWIVYLVRPVVNEGK